MIDFNATLFLQAGHFFLVWFLLDRFLFRSVVGAIQAERTHAKNLKTALEKERVTLVQEKEQKDLEWALYRKQFEKKSPNIEAQPALSYSAILCPLYVGIKSDQKKKLIEETSSLLVKRVIHD